MYSQTPNVKDRIGTGIAYMTFGIWGLIWLLISRTPAHFQKDFVKFHCFQSIFIGILYVFIPQGLSIFVSLLVQIFALIPGTGIIAQGINIIHMVLQQILYYGGLFLIIYCVVFCAIGKYTNIPWVSQLMNRMLR